MDRKYGFALDGEPWVIQKSNKVIGKCISSLKIMGTIYSYDWVALTRFSLFTSITIFSNISILFFLFLTFQEIFTFECSIDLNPTNPIKPTTSEWLFRCSRYSMTSVRQKLSEVTLANSKTPWHHHFYYKSMKSRNPIFTKNPEKMPTIAKCWQKQKK